MNDLLPSLYKEYETLNERLIKVKELIVLYGGSIEKSHIIQQISPKQKSIVPAAIISPTSFPTTWKARIEHVLKAASTPLSAREIGDTIHKEIPLDDIARVDKAVSQYLWDMKKHGDVIIDESVKGKRRYSLPNSKK